MVFLDPDFLNDAKISAIRPHKGYIAHFSLRMRKTVAISTSGLKSDATIVFLDLDLLKDAEITAVRVHLRQI